MFELPTVDYPTEGLVGVPEGFRLRPYAGDADLPDVVRLENAEHIADRIPERSTLENMRVSFAHPGEKFDASRDVTIALVGDEMVGYSKRDWVDLWDMDGREYRLHGVVDPAWRRRGIGNLLLRDSERQMRELAATHDTPRARILGSWSADTQVADMALLAANGYEKVRYFFDMVRRSLDDIPEIPMPDGLESRPVTPDIYRRVWDADVEAFRDDWGGFDTSEESFQKFISYPDFDPSIWVIAFDGDEPAGGVINFIDPQENEALGIKRGWLGSVWTRRRWRRRGLARATIARSLEILRDRGMTTAALGVDADNPSGALGLYEQGGFEVDFRSTAWRKPFEL